MKGRYQMSKIDLTENSKALGVNHSIDGLKEETKVKTKTKSKPDISDTFSKTPDAPLTKKDTKKEKSKEASSPNFKVSDKEETLKKASNIKMSDEAIDKMRRMKMDIKPDPDDPGYPSTTKKLQDPVKKLQGSQPKTPSTALVKPENIPAKLNSELTEKGVLTPSWNIVANLPGNMATAIRTVGRRLFKSFTNTPTDKIVMLGNVFNGGPNTDKEINAVTKWLYNSGQEKSTGDIDFNEFIPGYSAEIKLYDAAGCRFLLVKDFAGRYIYVWPQTDSVNMSNLPKLTKEEIQVIKEAENRLRVLAGIPIVKN
jgi:hypothetical protein